jgi:plasmid maintenance system antidote protein VapI
MPRIEKLVSQRFGNKVLTINDCARLLQCSRAHISNLINGKVTGAPNLSHARLGRRVVVKPEWLEDYLEKARR